LASGWVAEAVASDREALGVALEPILLSHAGRLEAQLRERFARLVTDQENRSLFTPGFLAFTPDETARSCSGEDWKKEQQRLSRFRINRMLRDLTVAEIFNGESYHDLRQWLTAGSTPNYPLPIGVELVNQDVFRPEYPLRAERPSISRDSLQSGDFQFALSPIAPLGENEFTAVIAAGFGRHSIPLEECRAWLSRGETIISYREFVGRNRESICVTNMGRVRQIGRDGQPSRDLVPPGRILPDRELLWIKLVTDGSVKHTAAACLFAQRSWVQRVGPAAARAFEDQQKLGASIARADQAERTAADQQKKIQALLKERADVLAANAQLREQLGDARIDLGESQDEVATLKKRLRDSRVAETTIGQLRTELEEKTRALAEAAQMIELLHVAEQHTSTVMIAATAAAVVAGPAPPVGPPA
jgi:hypothetical protein